MTLLILSLALFAGPCTEVDAALEAYAGVRWSTQVGREVAVAIEAWTLCHIAEDAPDEPEPVPPPPTTRNTGMGTNWAQWRPLVAAYFPAGEVDTAMCVIRYESGGNPAARNPSGATGLFQIMPGWQSSYPGDYTDPATNVSVAAKIWGGGGWGHWNAQGQCGW